jgi:hypothetical protein
LRALGVRKSLGQISRTISVTFDSGDSNLALLNIGLVLKEPYNRRFQVCTAWKR